MPLCDRQRESVRSRPGSCGGGPNTGSRHHATTTMIIVHGTRTDLAAAMGLGRTRGSSGLSSGGVGQPGGQQINKRKQQAGADGQR